MTTEGRPLWKRGNYNILEDDRIVIRGCVYVVFIVMLFLMWAKPVEIVDDFTEADAEGNILRVNGKPFVEYLAVILVLIADD